MKKGLIYCLICPKTNEPKYVGQTTRTLEIRLHEHKYKKDQKGTYRSNWIDDLIKNNLLEKITIWKLGEYELENIDDMEKYWIDFFSSQNIKLTNGNMGGKFGGHREWTEDINKRRSMKLMGIKRNKSSIETRDKISKSLIGKPGRNTGNKHTEKTKNKISNTKKGTIPWNRKKIKQYDKTSGEFIKEWNSSHEAASELKLSQGNIATVASENGRRKSTGGFIWKWSENKKGYERLERNS